MIDLINCPSLPKEVKFKGSSAGNKKKPVYKYVYDEKYGCPRRVLNGYIDLQEFIQQSANDVDFKTLGKMLVDTRLNIIGHFEVDGEVFDQTALPRDVREYETLYNKIKGEFDSLPVGIKELFGNDLGQFKNAWMNGSIGTILNTYYQSQVSPTTENKDETFKSEENKQ